MAPPTHHLRLLNPKPRATGIFHQFPRFPADIRCMIWEQALTCERLIRVDLSSTIPNPRYVRSLNPWRSPSVDVTEEYIIVLSDRPTISKLFRVNSESRSSALRFYRVQLPCFYSRNLQLAKGIFYFNPELDTLEVRGPEHFVKFAHDVWTCDPRHKGLLNMAIGLADGCLAFRLLSTYERNIPRLREAMSRLKHVMFMCREDIHRSYSIDRWWLQEPQFHRCRPFMAAIPSFSRQTDPRPIDAGLTRVFIGNSDPRYEIHRWVSLVAELGIKSDVDYRFMVGRGRYKTRITNRNKALEDFEQEEKGWEKMSVPGQRWPLVPMWRREETMPARAIGFWLFPIECLGPLPPVSMDHMLSDLIFDRKNHAGVRTGTFEKLIDLSDYKPELCLTHLP
ncbi:hypothetical protein FDECE_4786 [Fusarium decemcellulare]|nr:hypothetical protein FDECE_4786 [Fusarium decemcellulare]